MSFRTNRTDLQELKQISIQLSLKGFLETVLHLAFVFVAEFEHCSYWHTRPVLPMLLTSVYLWSGQYWRKPSPISSNAQCWIPPMFPLPLGRGDIKDTIRLLNWCKSGAVIEFVVFSMLSSNVKHQTWLDKETTFPQTALPEKQGTSPSPVSFQKNKAFLLQNIGCFLSIFAQLLFVRKPC